jgi:hypothetical protein
MEFLGVGLGMMTALLWGSADTIATLAARRLGTFKTTLSILLGRIFAV